MAGVSTAGEATQQTHLRLHSMPFGTKIAPHQSGVEFRLWAPTAHTVELMLGDRPHAMHADDQGWYHVFCEKARPGDLYKFRINGDLQVPDPASRYQPQDVHGPSQVIDPQAFQWQDTQWKGRPWEEVVLYELHVGTFTAEGTYQGVKEKLDYLVELGITAIELMPLSDFPGSRNWGYDGVLPYAPDSSYGTSDELKDLIQTAHQKGLMVFLDVVYNHFGPDGNYLHTYAEPFFTQHYHTPWGAAINFEGPRPVREFFIQNALYWLNEYHFDGLRFDAVHAIYDESPRHFLNELAETVHSHIAPDRHVHLVLENDDNASRFLLGKTQKHFDAQWNDDFHHAAHVIATGDANGYYSDYDKASSHKPAIAHLARCLAEGFAYQGEQSGYRNQLRGEKSDHLPLSAFVDFLQNHDQIGNRAFGERLHQLAPPEAMKALTEILLLCPSIPMIFMGEEWQSDSPFLFFCDFNPELGKLVTEGRRKEFERFPEFSNPETRERIPDPCSLETFQHSRLDWQVRAQGPHAESLALFKKLLKLRKQVIIPKMMQEMRSEQRKPKCKILDKTGMLVEWPLANGKSLVLVANPSARTLTLQDPLPDNIRSDHSNLIYQSGNAVAEDIQSGTIPAWAVLWMIG